jgi:hypoxanthine phosphoribosyltransferase
MQSDIDRILIPRRRIAERVREMAGQIGELYAGPERRLTIVCVLSGAIIFVSDLIRHLPLKMNIALVTISSYAGKTTQSRGPTVLESLRFNVTGRDVLLVDDILDSGQTLRTVQRDLAGRKPASLRTCVLLRKPAKAPADIQVDIVGFDIEDVFVVGYGLDYDGYYRNWPDIAVLKPHLYA